MNQVVFHNILLWEKCFSHIIFPFWWLCSTLLTNYWPVKKNLILSTIATLKETFLSFDGEVALFIRKLISFSFWSLAFSWIFSSASSSALYWVSSNALLFISTWAMLSLKVAFADEDQKQVWDEEHITKVNRYGLFRKQSLTTKGSTNMF